MQIHNLDINFLNENYDSTGQTQRRVEPYRTKQARNHVRGIFENLESGEILLCNSDLSMAGVNSKALDNFIESSFRNYSCRNSDEMFINMAVMKEIPDYRNNGLGDIYAINGLWMDIKYDDQLNNIPNDVFGVMEIIGSSSTGTNDN